MCIANCSYPLISGRNLKTLVLVDWDQTLCFDRYWRSLPEAQRLRVQDELFGGNSTLVHEWMRGEHAAEYVHAYLATWLGIEYEALWDVFVHDCETMRVAPGLLTRLNALRAQATVVLATGNMDSFSRFTVPALRLHDYFDGISVSWDERLHKSDNNGELFERLAARYRVPMCNVTLVDDNRLNCELVRAKGGTAYQVNPSLPAADVLTQLEAELTPSALAGT